MVNFYVLLIFEIELGLFVCLSSRRDKIFCFFTIA